MNESIIVPKHLYLELVLHAKKLLPLEACGLLSGKGLSVHHIWKLQNEAKSSKRFFVSENVVQETVEKASKLNEKILAIYHSHPTTQAVPSSYDIASHPDPTVKMIIISLKHEEPSIKCYSIYNKRYQEYPIVIPDSF